MRAIAVFILVSVLVLPSTSVSALASKNRPASPPTSAARQPQYKGATLTGETTDAAGARLPNQKVRLRHAATGKVVAETVSNGSAVFTFSDVAAGEYLLEMINAAGQVVGVSSVFSVAVGTSAFVTVGASASGAVAAAGGGISLFGLGTAMSVAVLAAAGAVATAAVVVTRREASVSR